MIVKQSARRRRMRGELSVGSLGARADALQSTRKRTAMDDLSAV